MGSEPGEQALAPEWTVAGEEAAIRWEPDAEFAAIPTWQNSWIWLEEMFGREFFVIDDEGG